MDQEPLYGINYNGQNGTHYCNQVSTGDDLRYKDCEQAIKRYDDNINYYYKTRSYEPGYCNALLS
jgi:hypothetical protein